jgi:hypothetical protein
MVFKKKTSDLDLMLPDTAIPIEIITNTNENWVTNRLKEQRAIERSKRPRTPKLLREKMTNDSTKLLGIAQLLMDEHDIGQFFSQRAHVETATDGGFNPSTGISSFGWIIAIIKLSSQREGDRQQRTQNSQNHSALKDTG